MDWLPQFIYVLILSFCGFSVSDHSRSEREYSEEDWHPLRERPIVSRVVIPIPRVRPPLPPPTYSSRSDSHATKKRLQLEPSPSNKVEVFAPAPPSILGSFSGFGHATVKAREPAHIKKKHPIREQQLSETRPSYTALLLPPPLQDSGKNRFVYSVYPQDEKHAAAYYYEASLRPPPRNIIPPLRSSDLPPNSYFFDSPKTNPGRFQEPNIFHSGFAPSSPGYRTTLSSQPPFETNYQFFSTDFNLRSQPTPVPRPAANVYYNRNPFGDITLSSRQPEVVKPVSEDKPPGKEVFHQLSHLGRPFQSPSLEFSSQRAREPFLTTVSSSIQLKDEKKQKPKYSPGQHFQFTQSDFTPSSHFPGPQQNYFVTETPYAAEIYPLTVKTVDIPSEDDIAKEKLQTSTPSNLFINSHKQISYHDMPEEKLQTSTPSNLFINSHKQISYHDIPEEKLQTSTPSNLFINSHKQISYHDMPEEKLQTSTPSNLFINSHKQISYHDMPVRTHRPHVEVSSYQAIRNESPPFLPTPAADVEPFIKEPDHNEEQFNEIQTSLPPIQNHRFPPHLKPTEESYLDNISTTASKRPSNSLKHRRRRPTRPTEPSLLNTVSTEETNHVHEVDSNIDSSLIPTNAADTPEELPTTTSSTTTRPQRRRKKPYRTRNRGQSNYIQSSTTASTPQVEQFHSTRGFHYQFSTPAATDHPDYTVPNTHVPVNTYTIGQDQYVNTEPVNDYTQTRDELNQDNAIVTQNYISTQLVDETQSSIEDEISEISTPTPAPFRSSTNTPVTIIPSTTTMTTTTTTTTTTVAPETSTSLSTQSSSYRTRMRNKYGNNTRPRFSVKDYRERLNRASTTTQSTRQEEAVDEDIPKVKYSIRTRGNTVHKPSLTAPEGNLNETTTEVYRKYKPRVRYSYKTSTTTTSRPLLQVDSPSTTTERLNTFKPNPNRYKPGTGKYYSRYRTSTESPATEANETTPSTVRTVRTKGVFSAKRRPYPLRTRVEGTNKEDDREVAEETKQYKQTVKTIENEIDPITTVMTKKMDNALTTTIMTSTNTEPVLIGPTGEEISTAQRIADLTSSPSNMYQSNGFRKGVSPSSRRTVPHITLATEDPILPLEAFFQSWSNNKGNNSR
ncbi:uncharacterized protein LOC142321324 [Lycorma delicatula]|uniref:uncharacterized protein LOC142321324 n=1 Tax=Lycorma delicatula TaxID=130591 RepID=UPI003F50DEA5